MNKKTHQRCHSLFKLTFMAIRATQKRKPFCWWMDANKQTNGQTDGSTHLKTRKNNRFPIFKPLISLTCDKAGKRQQEKNDVSKIFCNFPSKSGAEVRWRGKRRVGGNPTWFLSREDKKW